MSYVDDLLLLGYSDNIVKDKNLFLNTQKLLGWLLNFEKSKLNTDRVHQFCVGHSGPGQYPFCQVPHSRICRVCKDMTRLLDSDSFSTCRLPAILGQCASMAKAIFPVKLMSHNAYCLPRDCLQATRQDWDSRYLVMASATQQQAFRLGMV